MPRVMLVRHAEPEIDVSLPAEQWVLTSRGRESAARLVSTLAEFAPTVIIASPELKAVETAQVLADGLGLDLELDTRFSEHGVGPMEFIEDYNEFRGLVRRHFGFPDEVVMRKESSRAAGDRFAAGVQERLAAAPESVPVIVSHGRIVSSWLASLAGASAWEIWTELRMPDLIDVDLASNTFRTVPFPII